MTAEDLAALERIGQGFPEVVEDLEVLDQIAGLVVLAGGGGDP